MKFSREIDDKKQDILGDKILAYISDVLILPIRTYPDMKYDNDDDDDDGDDDDDDDDDDDGDDDDDDDDVAEMHHNNP